MSRRNKWKKYNSKPHTPPHSSGSTQKQKSDMNQQAAKFDLESMTDHIKTIALKIVQDEFQSLSSSLSIAVDQNEKLLNRIDVLEKRLQLTEGLLHQSRVKIDMQNEKIIDLQTRSMRDNLVVRGIDETENESWETTEAKVVKFMKSELKIPDAEIPKIDRAHRIGPKIKDRPRNVVVKFASSKGKSRVFKYVKNLGGKKQFGVQEQLPPEVQQRRNRLWPLFKDAKNESKTDKTMKVMWSADKLIINGKEHTAKDDVQHITSVEHCDIRVHTEHSQVIHEQGSKFQGHAASLKHGTTVADALAKLYSNHSVSQAEHNIYAYRIGKGQNVKEAYSDDGEHGAGFRLLQLLSNDDITDVLVVCTRWFGGTHIGPKRFTHITNCSNEALQKLNIDN